MNKICTDIEQSDKLIELGIDVNTADMYWWYNGQRYYAEIKEHNDFQKSDVPCWSLAALYSILPNNKKESTTLSRGGWKMDPIEYMPNTWWCEYEDNENPTYFNTSADNPVDACVAMIIKLSELKML